MGAIQIIDEPTHPATLRSPTLSPALPQRGNFEQQKKTSLRGGTTWTTDRREFINSFKNN